MTETHEEFLTRARLECRARIDACLAAAPGYGTHWATLGTRLLELGGDDLVFNFGPDPRLLELAHAILTTNSAAEAEPKSGRRWRSHENTPTAGIAA